MMHCDHYVCRSIIMQAHGLRYEPCFLCYNACVCHCNNKQTMYLLSILLLISNSKAVCKMHCICMCVCVCLCVCGGGGGLLKFSKHTYCMSLFPVLENNKGKESHVSLCGIQALTWYYYLLHLWYYLLHLWPTT